MKQITNVLMILNMYAIVGKSGIILLLIIIGNNLSIEWLKKINIARLGRFMPLYFDCSEQV